MALALGLALHNMVEGIAIAGPIYYASGDRARGLLWCLLPAVAEPLGALLGWLFIGKERIAIPNAVLLALVAGMMTSICIKELLPTALAYAGEKAHRVALGTFAGMLSVSVGFVVFAFANK